MRHSAFSLVDFAKGDVRARNNVVPLKEAIDARSNGGAVNSYITAYRFPEDYRKHVQATGSVAGYTGPAYADFLHWDVDYEGRLHAALAASRGLVTHLQDRFDIRQDQLRYFFSGAKGFHLLLPTQLLGDVEPSTTLPAVWKSMALAIAAEADVKVDRVVYDVNRLFRLPDTQHPSRLWKVELTWEELFHSDTDTIRALAKEPRGNLFRPHDLEPIDPLVEFYARHAEAVEIEAAKPRTGPLRSGAGGVAPDLAEALSGAYVDGQKHNIALAFAGYAAKRHLPREMAHGVFDELLESHDDPDNVHGAIDDTYDRVRQGQQVKGYTELREMLSADALQALSVLLGDVPQEKKSAGPPPPEFPGDPGPAAHSGTDWDDGWGDYQAPPEEELLARKFPAPMGIRELMEQPEPEEQWLIERLMPLDANLLFSGYPKSHKTNFLLEIGVAAATATPFLGKFPVLKPRRIGLVLMEDRAHRIRKRLERICKAHGRTISDLEGWLFIWFRPPLQFSHAVTMKELGDWVEERELDGIFVDNWALVSSGNSNDSDEVTPQLARFGSLRERRPIVAGLVHHAKKTNNDTDGSRLTDLIRNSGAFGAWYDAGFVLSRKDETSPVTVRAELRDLPSPDPFAFTVEDEYPAGPDQGTYPGGWLRLQVSDKHPEQVQRDAAAEKFRAPVVEFLGANQGCSKRQLRDGVPGGNEMVDAAFDVLCNEGLARFDPPPKKGASGRCWLMSPTVPDRAATVPGAHFTDRADRAAPPVGGQGRHGSAGGGLYRAAGDYIRL